MRSKRKPGYPVQCYNYMPPPEGMHVHTTPVKTQDSKTWDQFWFGLLVPGRREGREVFWLSDPTLTICKSLSQCPSQASWSVCWGWWSRIWLKQHPLPHSSLDRKFTQTLEADGYRLSIFQAARQPSLCALSFTQDLQSTLQSTLRLLLKMFYLSRPRVPKIQFFNSLQNFISHFITSMREVQEHSHEIQYTVDKWYQCLWKEKASTTKPCQFQGRNEEPFPKGFTPESHCCLSESSDPHALLIQHHLGNSY